MFTGRNELGGLCAAVAWLMMRTLLFMPAG